MAHRHHIVARSVLKGPYNWVIVDGVWLMLNLADLCWQCHDDLESQWGGCKSRLRFLNGAGIGWYDRATQSDFVDDKDEIWWYDDKSGWWKFAGFLKGATWVTPL